MKPVFRHIDLKLVQPLYDSKLTDLVIELDYLRKKEIRGSTHPVIFFQLKSIYHLLESIGSARIEGNRTTIVEYVESKIEGSQSTDERFVEIQNMEKAHNYIDENINTLKINRHFISDLHKIIVDGLTEEGSDNPGGYRRRDVLITNSYHKPPNTAQVTAYMEDLFDFINLADSPKYDLIKTAIAHHRFAWVHPFDNGNGRTVRLLTYAMLVLQGFNVNKYKIINPTAVFCNDREKYYNLLAKADSGNESDILCWCEYVLEGLKDEIDKIDKLLDYDYLKKSILIPMLKLSLERQLITSFEKDLLMTILERQVVMAKDLKKHFYGKAPQEVSRSIKKLREKRLITPEKENSRSYLIRFDNNYLLRSIIEILDKNSFLPVSRNS